MLVVALIGAGGVVALGLALPLPWQDPDFRLGPAIRMIMALVGATIMIIAMRPGGSSTWALRIGQLALGVTVLVYPTFLSLAAAGLGGSVVQVWALGGHVPPLVLVQLLPVLTTQAVTGVSRRAWLTVIGGVVVLGVVLTILVARGVPGAAVLSVVGSAMWLGSFGLAPIASWTGTRGTSGETRRRAVVAGLASVVPVVIIALCTSLGTAAETQGLTDDVAVTALMGGFSLAAMGSALLTSAAVGPEDSVLLRRRVVVGLLQGLLIAATALIAAGGALIAYESGLGATGTASVAIAVVMIIGFGAIRLQGWAARVVDPPADLRHEISLLGDLPDGEQRQGLQQVLRRVVGDPGLLLVVRAADGSWVDALGVVTTVQPEDAVRVAGPADEPSAVVVLSTPGMRTRVQRLGDLAALLRPAVLEATVLRETERADAAARVERDRLSQDLHDGLQGRLLGIALNLQLSGREVDDPSARLLVDQTVAALRDTVEDVRALAGGRLPATLVAGGLRPALTDLVRPLSTVVELRVADSRFAPEVEATGYFVVSEAVSNAIKHGRAEQVRVRVERDADQLVIMVSDDGLGGADPRLGSGLRGLAERVSASGGVLVVRDKTPTGTVVEASLPCGS